MIKRLLPFLLFLFLIQPAYATRTGTVISAGVTVGNGANTFASAYQDEIQGDKIVADLTARDAITTERRVVGMTCYVIANNTRYRLVGGIANGNWAVASETTAGSDAQLLFNDGGVIAGNAGFIFKKASGNIGIGSANPGATLDVQGNGRFSSTLSASNLSGTNTGDQDLSTYAPLANPHFTGNVGINTVSPTANLTIKQVGSQDVLHIVSSGSSSLFNVKGTGNVGIGSTTPNYVLDVNGTVKGTNLLTPSGNIGIGTTSPAFKFDFASAKTIYIGSSDSVSTAVTNAPAGSILVLGAGTYSNVAVSTNKSLFISCPAGPLATVLDNNSNAPTIWSTSDNFGVDGCGFTGDAQQGILVDANVGGAFNSVSLTHIRMHLSGTHPTDGIKLWNAGAYISDYTAFIQNTATSAQVHAFYQRRDGNNTGDTYINIRDSDMYAECTSSCNSASIVKQMVHNNNGASPYISYFNGYNVVSRSRNFSGGVSYAWFIDNNTNHVDFYDSYLDGGNDASNDRDLTSNATDQSSPYVLHNTILEHGIATPGPAGLKSYGSLIFTGSPAPGISFGLGTAAGDAVNIAGGAGGNTNVTTTSTAGKGANITMQSGPGGLADSANTTSNAGPGGDYIIHGGAGGSSVIATGSNIAGVGGSVIMLGGVGGAAQGGTTNAGGRGSNFTILSGNGGNATGSTATGGAAGTLTIGTGNIGIGTTTNGAVAPIVFKQNNSEKARFDLNGNFGIGSTAPGVALDVIGTIRASGGISGNFGIGTTTIPYPLVVNTSDPTLNNSSGFAIGTSTVSIKNSDSTANDFSSIIFATNASDAPSAAYNDVILKALHPKKTNGLSTADFQIGLLDQGTFKNALYLNGDLQRMGLGEDSNPSYSISFDGTQNNRSIGIERFSATTNPGKSLTINAGGASIQGGILGVSATPTAAGSGYVVGDVLTITSGNGTARVIVTTIDGSGGVTGLAQYKDRGAQYIVSTGNATSGGAGSGCTVSITSIATTSNFAGGNLTFQSGVSTGTGTSDIVFQASPGNVGVSTYDNTVTTYLSIKGNGNVITSGGGNVGIGSAAPGTSLDVNGTTRSTAFSGDGSALTAIPGTALTLTDVTTNNASISAHGFAPKLPNDGTKYYDGLGGFTVPAGGGGGGVGIGTVSPGTINRPAYYTASTTTSSGNGFYNGSNISIGTTLNTNLLDVAGGVTIGTTYAGYQTAPANGLMVAGNVSIGTTASSNLLTVGTGASAPLAVQAAQMIVLGVTTIDSTKVSGNTTGTYSFRNGSAGATSGSNLSGGSGAGSFVTIQSSLGTGTSDFINFATGSGSERMRMISSGNIGLGTTVPVAKFGIVGNIGIGTSANGDAFLTNTPPNGGMIIEKNVGIGSFNPGTMLDVQGAIRASSTVTGSNLSGSNTGDQDLSAYAPLANPHFTGNVGIGSANPRPGLDVGISTVYAGSFVGTTGGAQTFSGNVGIGSSAPGAILDVAGDIRFSGNFRGLSTGNVGIGTTSVGNQACDTTCTGPCFIGFDTTVGLINCDDSRADRCVCLPN